MARLLSPAAASCAMRFSVGVRLSAPCNATRRGCAIADGGYNISDDSSCQLTSPHSKSNTNPGLASAGLANNGGPTQTIALRAGSPAIDAIPPAACTAADGSPLPTDQRGYARPADGNRDGIAGCDVGAYEFGLRPAGGGPARPEVHRQHHGRQP